MFGNLTNKCLPMNHELNPGFGSPYHMFDRKLRLTESN